MDSFEVLRTQNHSGSFPSAEYSFLPEVSCPVSNGDVNHHPIDNFDLTNMQSALSTTVPDSTVQIHAQLLELVEENKSLKEKLNRNNAMMKDQMSTISGWRESMIASKEQLQQNLEKAKGKIAALEKENADLIEKMNLTSEQHQQSLENVKEKIVALEKENADLLEKMNVTKDNQKEKPEKCDKCLTFEAALNDMLALDASEEGDSFFYDLSYFRENLLGNLKHLVHLIENSLNSCSKFSEEGVMLKTYILLLKFKIASLEGGNVKATVQTDEESGFEIVYKKKSESQMQLLQDIVDLKDGIKRKDSELEFLKKERGELLEKVQVLESKMKELETNSTSQLELIEKKSQMEVSSSEKLKERCENLQQQLNEYKAKIEKTDLSKGRVDLGLCGELNEEIQNLREILRLEEQAKKELMDKYTEIMKKCEILQVDYDRVTKLLEIQTKDEKEKIENMAAEKENVTKEYYERIDQLMAQLFEKEEQMRDKDAEIMRLENELAKAKENEENIPILKAQVELYKTDYENLEAARDAASSEIEKLKNELKKHEKCESCNSASGGKKHARYSGKEEPECPFCSLTFKNLRLVEHHIQRVHDEPKE